MLMGSVYMLEYTPLKPYPGIEHAVVVDAVVLASEEGCQVGRIAGDDKDTRRRPKVLKDFTGPGLWGLCTDCVSKQQGIHHGHSGSYRVVLLPFPAPGIQTKRTVPLKHGHPKG